MRSLREHFRAMGLGNNGGSVLHGFFGLGEAPETLSLKEQMARVRRVNVLHLNVIRLAFDTVIPRAPLERKVDMAVHRTRQILDQAGIGVARVRSEEHTSELQSQSNLVCRLLLEKKKKQNQLLEYAP